MSDAEQNLVAWLRGQGMHDSAGLVERVIAERDALRAVLAKIRRDYSSAFMPEDAARIDAALKDKKP